jgi:hypothetical protein
MSGSLCQSVRGTGIADDTTRNPKAFAFIRTALSEHRVFLRAYWMGKTFKPSIQWPTEHTDDTEKSAFGVVSVFRRQSSPSHFACGSAAPGQSRAILQMSP